jgi:predicted ATPase
MYYKISGHKGIINETKIELAPITILIGKNGSGKSSTISALKEFKEIFDWKRSMTYNGFLTQLSFKILECNDNANENSKYSAPIEMSGLDGDFEIILSFKKQNKLKGIVGLEVFNKRIKKTLLKVDLINHDKENFESKIKVSIDYKFIKNQISKIIKQKDKGEEISEILSKLQAVPISDEQYTEMKTIESKLQSDYLNNLIDSGFYETNIKIKNKNISKGSRSLEIKNKTLKDFQNIPVYFSLIKDNQTYKNDDFLESLSKALHKNDLLLNCNYSTQFPFDLFISDLLTNKSSMLFQADIIKTLGLSDSEDFTDLRKLLNFKIILNESFTKVLDNLLFENLHLALVNLDKKLNLKHIPPNRINFSEKNNESPIDFVFKYTKVLKAAGYDLSSSTFFVDYWFKQFNIDFGLAYNDIDSVLNFLSKPNEFNKHGYGIQQLVPLIIVFSLTDKLHKKDFVDNFWGSYSLPDSKIFLVEEPEANLHPNFQSKLADMVIDSFWKYNNEFIIETHSEYFLRKLQLNVAKNKLDPSLVNIYYFDTTNQKPRKINLNEDGSLSENLGSGFLDESNNLATDLLISRLNQN